MSLPLEAREQPYVRSAKPAAAKKKHTYKFLLLAWVFLIASGVWGTKAYSDRLRNQIATRISTENQAQLEIIQKDYQVQLDGLKTSMETDMSKLQAKVEALTELLAFTKDNANSKTDNSNQLYTQLAEVKKQLDTLQQNLDVLK